MLALRKTESDILPLALMILMIMFLRPPGLIVRMVIWMILWKRRSANVILRGTHMVMCSMNWPRRHIFTPTGC